MSAIFRHFRFFFFVLVVAFLGVVAAPSAHAQAPLVTGLNPSSVPINNGGNGNFTLIISGNNFVPGNDSVVFNGTTYPNGSLNISGGTITLTVNVSDVAARAKFEVEVIDSVNGPSPKNAPDDVFVVGTTVTSLKPATGPAFTTIAPLQINGTNFSGDPGTEVLFDGQVLNETLNGLTVVSPSEITVNVPAGDVPPGGTFDVTVVDPTAGNSYNNPPNDVFTVGASPTPSISSITPDTATVNESPEPVVDIYGSSFTVDTTVNFNGDLTIPVNFINSGEIQITVPDRDLVGNASFDVLVSNNFPTPTWSTANPPEDVFWIGSTSQPTITAMSTNTAAVGGAAFTLTLTGTDFAPGTEVLFNNDTYTDTTITNNGTTLAVPILASDLTVNTAFEVRAINLHGGGDSPLNPLVDTFYIGPCPIPTVTKVVSSSSNTDTATEGAATGFTLTITGTNFTPGSTVNFNGDKTEPVTFLSPTPVVYGNTEQISIPIPPADLDLTAPANFEVTVTNPAGGGTGGGGTSALNPDGVNYPDGDCFYIGPTPSPAPAGTTDIGPTFLNVSGLSPTTAAVGGAGFTLTINGSGFVVGGTVEFGEGSARTNTYPVTWVSASQETVAIPASALNVADCVDFDVTVRNPPGGTDQLDDPVGGGTTDATGDVSDYPGDVFTIGPVPIVTAVTPDSVPIFADQFGRIAGNPQALSLTVTGLNFTAGDEVVLEYLNSSGAIASTKYVSESVVASATSIVATVPVADFPDIYTDTATGGQYEIVAVGVAQPQTTPLSLPQTCYPLTILQSPTDFNGDKIAFNPPTTPGPTDGIEGVLGAIEVSAATTTNSITLSWPADVYATTYGISRSTGYGNNNYGAVGGHFVPQFTTSISNVTSSTPITITTSASTSLTTGDEVTISGVGGVTAANGSWQVTVINATTFTLDGSSGTGTYQSGTGTVVYVVPSLITGYVDDTTENQTGYEYLVTKGGSWPGQTTPGELELPIPTTYGGVGRIYAGNDIQPISTGGQLGHRGTIDLLVDSTIALSNGMPAALTQLEQDMIGDGWNVNVHDVPRDPGIDSNGIPLDLGASVKALKAQIVQDYNTYQGTQNPLTAIMLFGHPSQPYSGQVAPDGHQDHVGAWPTDIYYADPSGTGAWSDTTVNVATSIDIRNYNIPGDGKFDQGADPNAATLSVGRVDVSNMPDFDPQTETDLLLNYLNKDHNYRMQYTTAALAGRISDNDFGYFSSGEAFSQNGWDDFATFWGSGNDSYEAPTAANFFWDLQYDNQSAIPQDPGGFTWAYGDGPGSFTSAGGVGQTTDVAASDPHAYFFMLFGSYFGDWGAVNDFLRAPLATPTYGLSDSWGGRPQQLYYGMALGKSLGECMLETQQYNEYGITIGLMGDPTLRMFPVLPPGTISAKSSTNGSDAIISWQAPANTSTATVHGYLVDRAPTIVGPFVSLTPTTILPATQTTFTDASPITSTSSVYMVRAVYEQQTSSGSYENMSPAAYVTYHPPASTTPPTLYYNPTVAIVEPVSTPSVSDDIVAGQNITISVQASDLNPGGSISRVDFYENGILLGSSGNAPYQFDWTDIPPGQFYLTAVATDTLGFTSTSNTVVLDVVSASEANNLGLTDLKPLTIGITSPSNDSTFSLSSGVTATATTGADPNSPATINEVDFYSGSTFLGTGAQAGNNWTINLSQFPAQTFTLTAVAVDTNGETATSSPITVTTTNPSPVLSSLNPNNEPAGSGGASGLPMIVTGGNFVSNSQVTFNGTLLALTSYTSTTLDVVIPASLLATVGQYNVQVTNPAPGGGTSSALPFTVNNQTPVIASLSPSQSQQNPAQPVTMTVNGSNFLSNSAVYWNNGSTNVPLSTTYVSTTELTATIPTAYLATLGTATVTVVNSGPSGIATSAGATFAITSPPPVLTSITPTSTFAGNLNLLSLTLNGTFNTGTTYTVDFGITVLPATVVSASQIIATIPNAGLTFANTGAFPVTARDNSLYGGTSSAQMFTVTATPAPTITSVSPVSILAGSGMTTITLTGTNFVATPPALTTAYFDGTALQAFEVQTVSLGSGNTGGTFTLTYDGQTTSALAYNASASTVSTALQALSPIGPGGVSVTGSAGGPYVITFINGENPVSAITGSGSLTGGTNTVTFEAMQELTVTVPSGLLASVHVAHVTVENPTLVSNTYNLPITNPLPTITSLAPPSAIAGGGTYTLIVTGSNYISGAVVDWNGTPLPTIFNTSTQLTATVSSTLIATAGSANITVVNPDEGLSTAQTYQITAPSAPTINSNGLFPSTLPVGSVGFTLNVTGTGFVQGAVVNWAGVALTTTYESSTELTAQVPASDLATAGTPAITVTNPPPGQTSNAVDFAVTNPAPILQSLSATAAAIDGPQMTITATGSNFVSASYLAWVDPSGPTVTPLTTTYLSSTSLQATIPASDFQVSGSFDLEVITPLPGGGTSGQLTFIVTAAPPQLTALAPTSALAGSAALTLNVSGTSFVNGAVVNWNGTPIATTFNSQTSLTAIIPVDDLATPTTAQITVTNPGALGGTSTPIPFSVYNPSPVVVELTPTSITAGSGQQNLVVSGTGFVIGTNGSTVDWNGTALAFAINPTTPDSSTSLTVVIPASFVASVTNASITVVTPQTAPNQGTSTPLILPVVAPNAPTITTLSPTSAQVGSTPPTIDITGTNFATGATVTFNGESKQVTVITAGTELSITLNATDLLAAGAYPVVVTNPAPGVASAPATFNIYNPVPVLTTITPPSVQVGSQNTVITLIGSSFASGFPGPTVDFGGTNVQATYISSTELTATLTAAMLATSGTYPVTVINPSQPQQSNSVEFSVNNPFPTISSLSPSSAAVGSSQLTLTITGTGFVSQSVVDWNGTPLGSSSYVSATEMTAVVPAALLSTAGDGAVTIVSPGPGGGTSTAVEFQILGPAPALTSLLPPSASVNGSAFTLSVNGTGFATNAVINWNGSPLANTNDVSATNLTATVPASDLTSVGVADISVTNPAPSSGGNAQTSQFLPFYINYPLPVITSIDPAAIEEGSSATEVTITGTGFQPNAFVTVNGIEVATTSVTATSLNALIPTSDLTTVRNLSVIVTNPGVGGGSSAPATIAVVPPGAALFSMNPSSVLAGSSAFTLTVNGTGFVGGVVVNFGGTPLATTYVSSTEVTATVPALSVATAGTAMVIATNPAPQTTPSNSLTFTINNPAPTITSLSPGSVEVGGPATTLTVLGAGFVPTSVVNFNGTPLATTFGSTSSLSAVVPSADTTTLNGGSVTVTNPSPGGGTSGPATLVVTPVATFPSGLQMISMPYDYSGYTFSQIFDLPAPAIAQWEPTTSVYAIAPDAPADTFRLGQGYWARFQTQADVMIQGTPASTTSELSYPEDAGWNQIGDPELGSVLLSSLEVVDQNGKIYSFDTAANGTLNLIAPVIYSYDPATNQYVAHYDGNASEPAPSIQPYVGYWLKANVPVNLVWPQAESQSVLTKP